MLQNLQNQLAEMPQEQQAGVQWFIERLKAYRQEKQRDLETFLHALDENALQQQVEATIPEGT